MESILVRLFPRRSKGRFVELSDRNPITIAVSAPQKPVLSCRRQARSCYPAWRQVSGHCALGIIGLAIAVVLWGYGYRISLYHREGAPSARIPVAKLWIEPHSASVEAASRLKSISHLAPGSQAFSESIQRLPGLNSAVASTLPLCERRVAFFDLPIPSRAPPPLRFRLAELSSRFRV
jgi:hypothetical protein